MSLARLQRQIDLNRQVGRLLASLREAQCIKQEVIAQRMGLTRSVISKIEHGSRRLEAVEIRDYALALEIDPTALAAQIDSIVVEYDGAN